MMKSLNQLKRVQLLLERIKANLFGVEFLIVALIDKSYPESNRIYLQVQYIAECTNTGNTQNWTGRKWYLSEYMTDDEIVKTAWCAFEAAVKHEVMEAFQVDGIKLFNPHINFEELLKVSHKEVKRNES